MFDPPNWNLISATSFRNKLGGTLQGICTAPQAHGDTKRSNGDSNADHGSSTIDVH